MITSLTMRDILTFAGDHQMLTFFVLVVVLIFVGIVIDYVFNLIHRLISWAKE